MNALLRFLVLCQYNTRRATLLLPCECKPKDRKQGCHGLGMRLQRVPWSGNEATKCAMVWE